MKFLIKGELQNFIRKGFPSAEKCQNGKKSSERCLMKQEGLLANEANHSFKWQGWNRQNDHNCLICGFGKKAVVADCDVDAPDLHMLLHPEILETQEFKGSKLAVIDEAKRIKCGLCREKCRFDAVTQNFTVDPFSCEGCGVCTVVCPVDAVTLTDRLSGNAYISKIKKGLWHMPCLAQAKQTRENL